MVVDLLDAGALALHLHGDEAYPTSVTGGAVAEPPVRASTTLANLGLTKNSVP